MAYGTVKQDAAAAKSPDEGEEVTAPSQDDQNGATAVTQSDDEAPGAPAGDEVPVSRAGAAWQNLKAFYDRNLGLFFVFLAQMCASIMSMTTRLLETGFETKFHALQIIFVRMILTAVVGSLYMWYKQVPDFPFGQRGVRGLLVLRGFAGTVGLFGLYYSLSYLDISDSTVITFLVPTITAFVCWVALGEPFTVQEACAGLLAFVGVMFIARPGFLFPHRDEGGEAAPTYNDTHFSRHEVDVQGGLMPPVASTPAERAVAVACATFGSFAAATAYATIRVIGKRTHSLVSVNYFATLATVSSFTIIMVHPDLKFEVPQSPAQWALLLSIGVSGFLLQVFITEGLQREKAGRATNLIYTQLVFALIIERVVWGTTPSLSSLLGGALIIGSAIWVSVQTKTPKEQKVPAADEERGLLESENEESRA